MLSLFISYLPYLLIGYFLYRSYQSPIFVMGIPYLMFFGPSLFFENLSLFVIPFRSFDSIAKSADILLFTWLILCWIIFRVRTIKDPQNILKIKFVGKKTNLIDYTVFFLILITCIGLSVVLTEYYAIFNVFDKFFILVSMFLGFFIVKDVALNTELESLEKFLFNIVLLNSLAAVLYLIHQGLHIDIYTTDMEYQTEIVNGQVITRTFWFMPVLLLFSVSFLLAFRKKNSYLAYGLVLINMLAIFITYTRSLLLNAILVFIFFFLLIGLKNKSIWKTIRGIAAISIAGIALFFLVSTVLPANTEYFVSRFKDLDEKPVDAQSNNLVYRFFKTDNVINKMNSTKTLFGYGPVTETQTPFVKIVDSAATDMVWAEIVFRWGMIGSVLFVFLYLYSILFALRIFMINEGLVAQLALGFLLTLASQLIEGLTSITILTPNRIPLSLWVFGLLSALSITLKNDLKEQNKIKNQPEVEF